MTAEQTVPKLFAAGLVPGLVLTVLSITVALAVAYARPAYDPPVGMNLFVIQAQAPDQGAVRLVRRMSLPRRCMEKTCAACVAGYA